jgi:hypothetical protein
MSAIWEISPPSTWFKKLKGDQVLLTGTKIRLLTLAELKQTPQETKLYNIFGQAISRKDADKDNEIRFGHLAIGPVL